MKCKTFGQFQSIVTSEDVEIMDTIMKTYERCPDDFNMKDAYKMMFLKHVDEHRQPCLTQRSVNIGFQAFETVIRG